MPPLSPIAILGEALFMSNQFTCATSEWPGKPDDQQYSDALAPGEAVAIPGQMPIPWFMAMEPDKYHQDSADETGKAYKDVYTACLDGVKFGMDMWRLEAKIKDLKVNAVTALGTPGCLDGPDLADKIDTAPMKPTDDNAKALYEACAKGVGSCFSDFADNVMVPGLPWYPAFAAFPGPMAPPMPNVPMPLIACPSSSMAKIIAPSDMKDAMIGELSGPPKDDDPDKWHEALYDAIATVLALAFLMWLPQQQVMLVMGKGPIPTFAPPYVPVGPVVMGDNIGAPGHLMA